MPRIARLTPIESIQVGPDSTVLPDGTIQNPTPYLAADITFDDGVVVQVERPLTDAKVQAAYRAARTAEPIDGVPVGRNIVL